MNRDGHLAVDPLAQLAAIWMLHVHGMLALFRGAGIVDDEDPFGTGQRSGHHGAIAFLDLLLILGALVDELLQGLLGVFDVNQSQEQGDAGGHRFDALALAVFAQASEVNAAPGELRFKAIKVTKLASMVSKLAEDFGGKFRRVGFVHDDHTNKDPERFVGA
jgi:hypothetical protein